jgi:hypothetical protein
VIHGTYLCHKDAILQHTRNYRCIDLGGFLESGEKLLQYINSREQELSLSLSFYLSRKEHNSSLFEK